MHLPGAIHVTRCDARRLLGLGSEAGFDLTPIHEQGRGAHMRTHRRRENPLDSRSERRRYSQCGRFLPATCRAPVFDQVGVLPCLPETTSPCSHRAIRVETVPHTRPSSISSYHCSRVPSDCRLRPKSNGGKSRALCPSPRVFSSRVWRTDFSNSANSSGENRANMASRSWSVLMTQVYASPPQRGTPEIETTGSQYGLPQGFGAISGCRRPDVGGRGATHVNRSLHSGYKSPITKSSPSRWRVSFVGAPVVLSQPIASR